MQYFFYRHRIWLVLIIILAIVVASRILTDVLAQSNYSNMECVKEEKINANTVKCVEFAPATRK